eukprot:g19187.t1
MFRNYGRKFGIASVNRTVMLPTMLANCAGDSGFVKISAMLSNDGDSGFVKISAMLSNDGMLMDDDTPRVAVELQPTNDSDLPEIGQVKRLRNSCSKLSDCSLLKQKTSMSSVRNSNHRGIQST